MYIFFNLSQVCSNPTLHCKSHRSSQLPTSLQVLEKGPSSVQNPILNILHCMLHYIDMNTAAAQMVNGDLLRVIAKYIEVRKTHAFYRSLRDEYLVV